MKKNREEPEQEDGKSERWLLTYSDMITLLLALFIILFSMSNADAEKLKQMAHGFSAAFRTSDTTATGGGSGNGVGYGDGAGMLDTVSSSVDSAISSGAAGSGPDSGATVNPLDKVYKTLLEYVDQNHLESQISLINADTYVRIRITGVLMFVPDQAVMLDSSKPIVEKIAQALESVYDEVDHITVSGHTADVREQATSGSPGDAYDAVSWRLSEDRAYTVLTGLQSYGLDQRKISLEGWAHFHPVAPNDTEANRAQNRRVEITVYKYPTDDSRVNP